MDIIIRRIGVYVQTAYTDKVSKDLILGILLHSSLFLRTCLTQESRSFSFFSIFAFLIFSGEEAENKRRRKNKNSKNSVQNKNRNISTPAIRVSVANNSGYSNFHIFF